MTEPQKEMTSTAEEVLGALGQISDLLIYKLNRFVDADQRDGASILLTRAQAVKIQQHLGALVDKLAHPGILDDEGKALLAGKLFDLLVAVNTASHGFGNIIDFLENSKAKTLKNKRAEAMRLAKKPRMAANHLNLDRAVEDEAESHNRAIAIGDQFARDMRDGVCARLDLNPDARGMTTISAIVRSAQRIRARRAKKGG